jgi:hemerythrin-like domain-containing protein
MAKLWADTPFALLPIPGQPGARTSTNPGVLSVCIEMANVHNALLRGLNSIYLQAPHVSNPTDIADFLLYTQSWADTVHHHHSLEEQLFFPAMKDLAVAAGIEASVMEANVEQHHAFEPKVQGMLQWVTAVRDGKKEWNAKVLVGLIDAFAETLTQHLHDEIETLIRLEPCDGEAVKKTMGEVATEGAKTADPVCQMTSSLELCLTKEVL